MLPRGRWGGESWKETYLGWEGLGREEEGDLRVEVGGGRGWEGGRPSLGGEGGSASGGRKAGAGRLERRIIPAFLSARNSSSLTQCFSGSSRPGWAKMGAPLPVSMWYTTLWSGGAGPQQRQEFLE